MPWREMSPMDHRTQSIADYLRGVHSVTELCQLYGISRKTAYKWIDHYLRRCRRPTLRAPDEPRSYGKGSRGNPRISAWFVVEDASSSTARRRPQELLPNARIRPTDTLT